MGEGIIVTFCRHFIFQFGTRRSRLGYTLDYFGTPFTIASLRRRAEVDSLLIVYFGSSTLAPLVFQFSEF